MRIQELETELKERDDVILSYDEFALRKLIKTSTDSQMVAMARTVLRIRAEIEDCEESIRFIDRLMRKQMIIQTESGDLSTTGAMNIKEEQNLLEMAPDPDLAIAGRSRNSAQGQQETVDMADFLRRPVEIHTGTLPVGSSTLLSLEVWDILTKLPAVRSKLRNYAFLRANLHAKISISGTPFHYGKVIVSYQPLHLQNDTLINVASNAGTSTDGRRMYMNYLSQAPGAMVMSVNQNIPTEVVCPFISPTPMVRLFNESSAVLSGASSFSDLSGFGALKICTINPPAAVSASPTPIYIQVYAWLEDVQLGTTTGTQIAITTESGKIGNKRDERKTGPVEAVASRALAISTQLTKVPYLYPYAKASEMAFGALKGVSALFGWSKPVINQEITLVKNEPYSSGSNVIGVNTSKRIVLDPLQELSVDSTFVGVTEDDLVIANIAGRMTYLTSFDWNDTATGLTTPIWICENSPNLVTFHSDGTNIYSQPTAMAFAALPFTYWRGTITYRFEIVCSSFHRGRLAFYFEPNVAQRALINADISLNKQFMRVIDIQETNVIDIDVKWGSVRPWLKVGTAASAYTHSDQTHVSGEGYVNGYIGVIPFTALQSPDSSDIKINVYVCCKDLQVNGCTSYNLPTSRKIYVESGDISTDVDVTELDLNNSSATTDGICEDYFGEQPLSFRSLLKRFIYQQQMTISANVTTAPKHLAAQTQIFPINNLIIGATSYPTGSFDYFTYLRYAYLGMRGSIRVRARFAFNEANAPSMWTKFSLSPPSTTMANASAVFTASNTGYMEGTETFVLATNAGLEVEFPYYSNNLFALSFNTTTMDVTSLSDTMWFRNFYMRQDISTSSITASVVDIERAAGEDFTFLRFSGAPAYAGPMVA